jgi:hypothetical protein
MRGKDAMTARRKVIVWLTASVAAATAAVLAGVAGTQSGSAKTRLSSEKQRIVDDQAAQLAAANRAAAPKSQVARQRPAATRLPDRVSGLVDMHQGPFAGAEFCVANFWQGPVRGRSLLVYAGGVRTGDGSVPRGGLRLYTEPVDPNVGSDLTRVGEYAATSSKGALRVVGVSGTVATLQDGDGRRFQFDLVSKSFQ